MLKLLIQQIGNPLGKIVIDEKTNIAKFRNKIFQIGVKTHNFMLEFIAKNTTAFKDVPQDDAKPLIETIDYTEYYDSDGFGWGIGNIDKLNAESKHWYICLSENTEIYINDENNNIIPVLLKDVFIISNHKKIKILTPWGLRDLQKIKKSDKKCGIETKLSHYKPIESTSDHKFLMRLNGRMLEKRIGDIKKSISSYGLVNATLDSVNKEKSIDKDRKSVV